jgi:hypothetical protein
MAAATTPAASDAAPAVYPAPGPPAELATVMRLIAAGYQHAAHLLHRDATTLVPCEVMESLAVTDAELHTTASARRTRYATRPPTEAGRQAKAKLRTGRDVESGQAGQGIDGAHSTKALLPALAEAVDDRRAARAPLRPGPGCIRHGPAAASR